MFKKEKGRVETEGTSKTKLVLGAAGLLLFILGVRRSFHLETPAENPRPQASTPTDELPAD
jgi:hypothetical protein